MTRLFPTLRALLLCCMLLQWTSIWAQVVPQTFSGKVVAIKDGDTIEVLHEGKAIRVRLAHIDCPEKGQPFGNNAKQFASDLCFDGIVRVEQTDRPDRYGRLIAEVFFEGECLNKELVRAGLAWHFLKYSNDVEYARLERDARSRKAGLWSDPHVVAPWDWRKGVR